MTRRHVTALLAPAFLALAGALHAQGTTSPWAAWIGCWDQMDRSGVGTGVRVCVLPTANSAVAELVNLAGDSVISRQRLDATADKREVRTEECNGIESVTATGTRAYFRTSMKCGTQGRLVNSVMAMSSGGEWIDVRGVAFGTNAGVKATRYREAPESARLPAEVATALRGHRGQLPPARIAAMGPVQLRDVIEASRHLEVGVLQTWLAERGQGFGLDAQSLLALEEAGVAPSVIDIMVALSYPAVFALDRTRLGDAPPDVGGEVRGEGIYGDDYVDGFGYGWDPYGYGYGRGNDWFWGRQPVVVVQRPSGEATETERGQVVKDRGYVAPRDGSGSGGGSAGRSGGSGGSSGSDRGSSTGRKAKPKGT